MKQFRITLVGKGGPLDTVVVSVPGDAISPATIAAACDWVICDGDYITVNDEDMAE
jgi:hypothetical protein